MSKKDIYKDYIYKMANVENDTVDSSMEKVAGSKFKELKKNEVPLTPEERAEVIKRKAVWESSHGPGTPAVWKSVNKKTGETTFVTHTHRAYNTAPTLKGAISRFHNFIKSTASENIDDGLMEKIAERHKKDPYKMTKLVGVTNAIGIPGDMAFDYIVEGIDQFKHRNRALHGNNPIKVFTSPEVKEHFKRFGKRQSGAALPLSVGVAGAMTLPVFVSEYKANHKNAYEIVNEAFEKIAEDKKKLTYAIDFDGTIVTNKFPEIGTIKPKTADFIRKKKAEGHTIIIWTCRSGKYLSDAKKFLKDNNIPYDYINENPDGDFGSRKINADYYVDDKAINIEDISKIAHQIVNEAFEKIAKEQVLFHASPVQDIKKFRTSEDTSGNNKGEIVFASKEPGFAAAFGAKWNDGTATLVVDQDGKADKPITTDNFDGATLKVTDDVDLDKPASMYKLKGDFKNLRHKDDIECYTDDKNKVKVVEEEKFDTFKELAKKYGLKINKVSEKYIDKKLESKKSYHIEKEAKEQNLNDFDSKGKIPVIEAAFSDPIAKKVAYMIATSHEYKKPNITAALTFTKNYKWELSTAKINDLQGINKPVDKEKVADMVKNMKVVKPFIVVNQLDAIRPQTPGKKILIDGHHRWEACKEKGMTEVPIYKGTYTGNAEKSLTELREKTAYEIIDEAFEKTAARRKDKTNLHLNKVRKAGNRRVLIDLNYTDKKNETTQRLVEPYEIKDGKAFYAYDVNKEGIRRFSADNVNRIKITNTRFNPRWEIKMDDYVDPVKRVRVDKEVNRLLKPGNTKNN